MADTGRGQYLKGRKIVTKVSNALDFTRAAIAKVYKEYMNIKREKTVKTAGIHR